MELQYLANEGVPDFVDGNGMLKKEYSHDGLHPNDRGYALLAPIGEDAIEKALGEKP